MNDNLYYLAFSHFLPIGPMRLKKLKEYFGSIQKAYEANEKKIAIIIGSKIAHQFCDFRSHFNVLKQYNEIKRKEIVFLSQEDTSFPPQLREIPDPPIGIYVKGNYKNFDFGKDIIIAIVGTRKPTAYGQQIAKKIASDLAVLGSITISGMAIGIDALVHKATLEVQGKTIAVLGCGVDIIYPSINTQLYSEIIKSGSLIISEFSPGQTVQRAFFIQRNRIISGLSRGVVVIEGMKDSGTLITSRFAAEQGKEIFAIPSPITSPLSEAPNLLLKQGAKLVTCIEDIVEELGLEMEMRTKQSVELNEKERTIQKILKKEPKSADELESELTMSLEEILQLLSLMELKNLVEKNSEGKYQIK